MPPLCVAEGALRGAANELRGAGLGVRTVVCDVVVRGAAELDRGAAMVARGVTDVLGAGALAARVDERGIGVVWRGVVLTAADVLGRAGTDLICDSETPDIVDERADDRDAPAAPVRVDAPVTSYGRTILPG